MALFSSEQDITVEANPYQYKLPAGIAKEVSTRAALMELRILRRLAETWGVLTDSEKAQIDELERKWLTLLEYGHIGSPRRRIDF